MKFEKSCGAVVFSNNKVLIIEHNYGHISFPKGHVEKDETLIEAIIREVKEELGIVIHSNELSLAHVMHRRKYSVEDDDRVEFFFLFSPMKEYEFYNRETEFCSELSWFSLNNIPTNTADYILNVIENIEKNNLYSTFGW